MLTQRGLSKQEQNSEEVSSPAPRSLDERIGDSYNAIYAVLNLGNKLPHFLTNQTAHIQGCATIDLWNGGLGTLMTKAEAAAKAHPSQICRFYVGPYLAAYIRDQKHIKAIYFKTHSSNPHEAEAYGDNSGIYPYLFGPSILSYTRTDPRWQKDRTFYVQALMTSSRLEFACGQMVSIMQEQLKNHSPTSITNIAELRTYVNRAIATMVAHTQLGIIDLTNDEKDKLAQLVADGLPQMASFKNIVYFKMEEKLGCRPRIPLDKTRADGYEFLQRLLDRNKEHILKEPKNGEPELFIRQHLRKLAEEKRQEKIKKDGKQPEEVPEVTREDLENVLAEDSKRFAALVLFAGYESTSTSTFFNLMLLADPNNHAICEEVRNEILTHWNPNEPLTKAHLDKMHLLENVILEALRLYPPFPTFKDMLAEDVKLGDVELKKGTFLFQSPFRAHRNDNGKNVTNPSTYMLRHKLSETDSKCHLTTFGFNPRLCVGRKVAILENKIVSVFALALFNFQLKNMKHPFEVKEVYSLHLADNIDQQNEKIEFTLRNRELTPQLAQACSSNYKP